MFKGFQPHGLIIAAAPARTSVPAWALARQSAFALVLALAACGAPPVRHHAAAPPIAATAAAPVATYRIDTARSELRVLVYRGGPLAAFGHDHVVINHTISGSVEWGGEASAPSFTFSVPSAAFIVDDRKARLEEGDEFAAEISDDAKSATLRNMLSAAVLDAEEFPEVSVRSLAASAGPDGERGDAWSATLAIRVAGHESTVDVPFTLTSESGRLCATGSTQLRQSAIGLRPFSAILGALQVQDALTIKFRIVAALATVN